MMARGGLALVVNGNVKASSTRELIEEAKRDPGKLNYASRASARRSTWRWSCSRARRSSISCTCRTRARPRR